MQAAHSEASQVTPSGSCLALTMSAIASRPPGRSAAAAAANTAGLSGERLMTPLEITQSIEPGSTGGSSIWPLRNSTLAMPASAARSVALVSCSAVMSMPITLPASPAASAARKESVPEPLPRSSTTSPGAIAARSRK